MNKLFIPPALIFYCIISMLLLHIFVTQYNLILFPYNLIGLIIAFLGFILTGKTRDLFKKYDTTLKIEKSNRLIKEGVFSKTRNPMYVGMFIMIPGISIFSTNIIAVTIPFVFLILISLLFIKKEEQLMYEVFGKEYIEYKESVKRWL